MFQYSFIFSVFLVDRCYRYDRLPVNGQIRLQLTRNSTYPPNLDCFQTFEANYGQRLMVYFRSLNIQSDDTCNYDSLEVDDGISRSSPFLNGIYAIKTFARNNQPLFYQ